MAVTSEDIKKAQEALKAKGLEPGTDGKMDAKTQQALRDFQKANDLTVTGVLDEKTAAKLGVHLGAEGKSMPGQSRGSSSSGSSSLDSSPSGSSSSGSSSSSPQTGSSLR
jgi:peptidoglycan hydrolase-like protein with peptidoglycan-binding domain